MSPFVGPEQARDEEAVVHGGAWISGGALALALTLAASGALPLGGFGGGAAPSPSGPSPRGPDPAPTPTPGTGAPTRPTPPSVVPATGVMGPLRLTVTPERTLAQAGAPDELTVVTRLEVGPADDAAALPVDLALVLDTSGSMAGAIQLLREATQGVIDRLGPDDRLALVTYSSGARLLFTGAVDGDARERLRGLVAGLAAGGGTNLSGGLEAGAAALAGLARERDGLPAARRLLLLTDGLANAGLIAPDGLAGLVGRVRGDGVGVSTAGLGASYDETLLGRLADAGGGAFHHLSDAAGLDRVYAAELGAARQLAAREATLVLTPGPGAEVVDVTSWPGTRRADGALAVRVGDLPHGRTIKVVARVRAPASAAGAAIALVRASVEARPAGAAGAPLAVEAALAIGATDDARAVAASKVDAVAGDVAQALVSRRLDEAREAAGRGEGERARELVRSLREVVGEKLSYDAPSGERKEVALDALASELASGEAEAAGEARKVGAAAARAAGR